MLSGRYAWATGKDLRDLDSRLVMDISAAYLSEMALRTKEEVEALERVDNVMAGAMFEAESGLPAITQRVLPADASQEEKDAFEADQRRREQVAEERKLPSMPPAGMRPGMAWPEDRAG